MIEISYINVTNFENAMRGMRHPLDSHDKGDTKVYKVQPFMGTNTTLVGANDFELAMKLIRSGSDHRKFMRQIFVSMDITAPLYWWKEMDTYKVSTTANSTSTMHTLHKKGIVPELFSVENLSDTMETVFENYCSILERKRLEYVSTKKKSAWRELIQMLPSSFNQTRTWTGTYESLRSIYHARKKHKLQEWLDFCEVIEFQMPYYEFITAT